MKIAVIYGSDTGNTKHIAHLIQSGFGKDLVDIYDVASIDVDIFSQYSIFIFGIPTWYDGELQSDWELMVKKMNAVCLKQRIVAVFGLGDQENWGRYFVDAMGALARKALHVEPLWQASGQLLAITLKNHKALLTRAIFMAWRWMRISNRN